MRTPLLYFFSLCGLALTLSASELNRQERSLLLEVRQLKDESRLERVLQDHLNTNPKAHAALYLELGSSYLKRHELNKARSTHASGLKAHPGNKDLHHNIAVTYQRLKRYAEAAQHFSKALSSYPPTLSQSKTIGQCLLLSKQYLSAKSSFTTAIAHYPQDPELHSGLIHCLMHLEEHAEALTVCRESLKSFPGRQDLRRLLPQLHLSLGQEEKAIDTFEALLIQDPNAHASREALADLYLRRRMHREAARHYRDLPNNRKEDPQLRLKLARLAHDRDDHRECLRILESLSNKERGDSGDALLAHTYRKFSQHQKAYRIYQNLCKDSNANGRWAYELGSLCLQLGKTSEAKLAFERAKLHETYRFAALTQLLQIALSDKQNEAAIRLLKEGLKLNTQDPYLIKVRNYHFQNL